MARPFIHLGVLLATTGLTDCIAIPLIPHDIGRAVMFDPSDVGVITKQDVLDKWGQPSSIFEDERIFIYSWDHVGSGVYTPYTGIFYSDNDDFHEIHTYYALLIQFSGDNRVSRAEHVEVPANVVSGKVSYDDFVRNWLNGPKTGTR